jgi:lipopolysaccharide transport system permease protein
MTFSTTTDPAAAGPPPVGGPGAAAANPATGAAASPAPVAPAPPLARVRLVPAKGWQALDLKELWRYRELIGFLALRDIKVRYKQTALGVAWAVIQPLVSTFVFTLFFNRLAGIQGPAGTPYELWVFAAMIPWLLFANALGNAGNSLVGSQNLITKVYFPRLSIPISTIVAALVDFAIAFALLLALMLCYGRLPGAGVLALPALVLVAVVAALAVGLWLSALNVQYRDVRYVLPFLTQIWFFASPILYQSSLIGQKLGPAAEVAYGLNPMVGVIEGFRWALLGTPPPSVPMMAASAAATLVLLVGGLYYFRRMEQTFADVV